jgi:hypothetical protein
MINCGNINTEIHIMGIQKRQKYASCSYEHYTAYTTTQIQNILRDWKSD